MILILLICIPMYPVSKISNIIELPLPVQYSVQAGENGLGKSEINHACTMKAGRARWLRANNRNQSSVTYHDHP